jgi:hypothetical protein
MVQQNARSRSNRPTSRALTVIQMRVRPFIYASTLALAITMAVASGALGAQQVIKCYFKDCLVFEDGSRFCTIKEVPCESQT